MAKYISTLEEVEKTSCNDRRLFTKEYILSECRGIGALHVVYFLISGREIVYVGKSSCGMNRIYTHLRRGNMIFDSYYYKITTPYVIDRLEKRYIKQFNPKYNKQHAKVKVKEIKMIAGKKVTFKHKRQPKKPWTKGKVRSFMKKQAKAFLYA